MSAQNSVLSKVFGRREFSMRMGSILSVFGCAATSLAASGSLAAAEPPADEDISHNNEAIHMEVIFKASRKRVYEALTDAKQFDKVVMLSAAMKAGMDSGSVASEITSEAGGAFSIFGGYIRGRFVELVPNERIIQAWRTGGWNPGVYSIAKFELIEQGAGTKLVFDHAGFPQGEAEHLDAGWKANYWEPLAKSLA